MAKYQPDIVESAVNGVLVVFEKYFPTDFDKINKEPKKKKELLAAARVIAVEEVKIAKEFSKNPEKDVRKRLANFLTEDRLVLIEEGFTPQTYQIHINKKDDGFYYADFIRDGRPLYVQKKLDNALSIEVTSYIQIASIIVEAILLVLQAVGIEVAVSEQTIAKTAEEIIPVIESSSQLQKAVQALEDAAKSGSSLQIARAIFNLIKDSYSAGILWTIIKSLCSNMSWLDWAKTAAIVTAMIIAALATDGAALIAKIVLALNSAYNFLAKLVNLDELEKIKKEIK